MAVKSKAAESAEAFSASNIKSAHIRFLADQSAKTNLSGPQLLKVAQLREDNEYSSGPSGSGSNGNGSGNLPIEEPEP